MLFEGGLYQYLATSDFSGEGGLDPLSPTLDPPCLLPWAMFSVFAGGDDNNVSFVLIIVIVLVAVILGVIIVVLIVMKQRNPDMCRRKPSAQKQELSTMQYRHSDSTEMTRVAHRRAEPSAPPDAEPVMTFDPQHVAPPTYEESARHQIAPSNY